MNEPPPYRTGEQVIAEWIAYYQLTAPGEIPPVGWLTRKTLLSRPYVYAIRRKIVYFFNTVSRKKP